MPSPFFKLLSSVWDYKSYTLLGIFFHILTALLTVVSIPLVIPFFQILFGISPSNYRAPESLWDLENVLNYGFSRLIAMSDHFVALWVVCIAVVIIFFLKNLCRFLISYFMIYVRNGLLRDLRRRIWKGYERLSLTQRYEKRQGYLMSLITNDLAEVDHGILKVFELLFKTPLVIIGSLLFMIWLSPKLTLIAFALIIFTLIVIGGVSHVLKRASAEAQESLSGMTILVDQYLSATKMIRTHHADGFFSSRFDDENNRYFKISNKILRRRDLASPLAEFLGVVTIVVLLFYGTHAVFNDDMEPATFFAFIFAFYNIIDPAKSFSREYANVQKGMAALERINGFNDEVEQDALVFKGDIVASFKDAVVIEDVSFSYGPKVEILKGLSLNIRKGEKIGIVGDSGVGKTTVIDLLLGFFTPQGGAISVDSVSISDMDESSYRKLFGLVTQRSQLFFGSIAENIVMDLPMDTAKLYDICTRVGLEISSLEDRVGDHSSQVSGGESQRISLARALYRDPQILILDEPTSQLDLKSSQLLIDNITANALAKTVIMITHQVRLLKKMDRIILMKEGKIMDEGQYEHLYERNDFFRSLVGDEITKY